MVTPSTDSFAPALVPSTSAPYSSTSASSQPEWMAGLQAAIARQALQSSSALPAAMHPTLNDFTASALTASYQSPSYYDPGMYSTANNYDMVSFSIASYRETLP